MVLEAREHYPEINTSEIFVSAAAAKLAALEALDAGIRVITLHPERSTQQDMLEVIANAKRFKGHVIGPNIIGLISPGKALNWPICQLNPDGHPQAKRQYRPQDDQARHKSDKKGVCNGDF